MNSFPQKPGLHEITIMPGMQQCWVSIPSNFKENLPTPVILALHWGGPVSKDTGRELLERLILPGLGELNAIIIAPNRIREHWATVEAEDDLFKLWSLFKENYHFDLEKTLITGYSMGGIGAWQMASKHPYLFKAVMPISAQAPAIISTLDWKLPTYVIHSKQDEIFPYHYTVDIVDDLIYSGADVQLKLIKDLGHFQIAEFIPSLNEAAQWLRTIWR